MLVARRSSAANWEIATATPTTAIEASTTRRMKRSRVSVTGSSSIPSRERIRRPWRLMTRSTRKMSTAAMSRLSSAVMASSWAWKKDSASRVIGRIGHHGRRAPGRQHALG